MSCRALETSYRAWGTDITPNESTVKFGLGWTVKLRADFDFLGRWAAERAANDVPRKRRARIALDDPDVVLLRWETILRDGVYAGYLTSGGFGYTVGCSSGYGYVCSAGGATEEWVRNGRYELVVAGERLPAQVHLGPLYDPDDARFRV